MNQSKISVRYAKALFELALEKNKLDEIYKDITLLSQVLKENATFGLYLKSPVVKPSQKLQSVRAAFQGNINEMSLNFISLLIQNKRENHLEDIVRRFFDVYREFKGIKSATVTTAVTLDNSLKKRFQDLLSSAYKSGIELQEHIEPSIIGGFILKVEDQQYDASVATGLKKMKTALLSENVNK